MDKKLKLALLKHFAITSDGKFYECLCYIEGDEEQMCKAQLTTGRISNLKRHLQRYHPKVLEEVDKANTKPMTAKPSSSSSNISQPGLSKFYISDKITVTMTAENFKSALIKMVVQNSIPISFFSQSAFLELNGEMANKLKVSLGRESIRKMILDEAEKHRSHLIEKLKGNFVFIKMDGCTRHRVNYIAINVRFNNNKETITQTLAVKDTQAHHTSEYIKNILEEILKDFKIKQVMKKTKGF